MQPRLNALKSHFLSACLLVAPLLVGGTLAWAQAEGQARRDERIVFDAYLVDAKQNADHRTAVIEVMVAGMDLVDPAAAHEVPKAGQGHIRHQIDGGIIVDTTQTRLAFHNLKSGSHTFEISLARNNLQATGNQKTLTLMVP